MIELRQTLPDKGDIDVYFIVPAGLYSNYEKQDFVNKDGSVSKSKPRWISERVKQHVLKIDLSV